MKILLCHNYYQQPGGEDQVFHDERDLLASHGHDVLTYTRHNDELKTRGSLRVLSPAAGAVWSRRAYRELRELLRRERPDLMHCTNVFPLISPAAYYAARAERVPVVQSVHNFRLACVNGYLLRDRAPCEDCLGKTFAWKGVAHGCYRESRAASAAVATAQSLHRVVGTWRRAVRMYIAVSNFAQRKLVQAGLPAEKIVVKPNCVYPDQGPGDGSGDYAIFVGRLSPEKGLNTLLAAWSKLTVPTPLKIVGDGPLLGEVQQAAQRDARIQPLGRLPLEQVLQVVGGARFLIMPSIWYETFGRTVIEAFSKGTPAIVSRMGAMQELIDEGRTGLCFTPGDPGDLATKAESLLSANGRLTAMRAACRDEFEQKYTAEANYRQLITIYEQCLAHA
jgi:glycosyltransferase involved in cell wall biosynthesis